MKDETESFSSKVGKFLIWLWVFIMIALWIGILTSPLFLRVERKKLEKKYEGFDYKDDLVNEEMKSITRWSIGSCIVGWILTIAYFLFVDP